MEVILVISVDLPEQEWENIAGAILFLIQNHPQMNLESTNYYSGLGLRLKRQIEQAKTAPMTISTDDTQELKPISESKAG